MEKQQQHVLVTTDFSELSLAVVPYVRDYLTRLGVNNGTLTVLSVLEDLCKTSVTFEYGLALLNTEGIMKGAQKSATTKLEQLIKEHFSGFITTGRVVLATKSIAEEIVDFAKTSQVDQIFIATHGRTGVRHLLLGSVAEGVIRQAPCPILVVPVRK